MASRFRIYPNRGERVHVQQERGIGFTNPHFGIQTLSWGPSLRAIGGRGVEMEKVSPLTEKVTREPFKLGRAKFRIKLDWKRIRARGRV